MRDKDLFEYAVVRVLPRVEREEFLNVGIVLYCAAQEFLQTAFELNEARLRTFGDEVSITELQEQLRAFEQVCAGGKDAEQLGDLPRGERFRWLTAPRSTVVQTSPVHTGLCIDARETLQHLLAQLVR